jgi:hypothetical protein
VEGLPNETTEGRATMTADACVRASAQWPLTNGYAGSRLAGRISQARPQFDRSRRSLFKETMIDLPRVSPQIGS